MEIDSVYVLLPDGRCIFSKTYRGDEADPQLLGGLLSAFNIASQQWLKDPVRRFVSEGDREFVIKDFESFVIVLSGIISKEEESNIDTIAMRFLSKYGSFSHKWAKGKISMFKDFDDDLNSLLKQDIFDQEIPSAASTSDRDQKILDSITIINLPSNLQKTAISLLSIRSGTASRVASETGRTAEEEEQYLNNLLIQGYIYRRTVENEKIYYVR